MTKTLAYRPATLLPYINWLYFFHAWGFPPRFSDVHAVHDCPGCRASWIEKFKPDEREQAREADRLYRDALRRLSRLDDGHKVMARFGLFPAVSEGDDVIVFADAGRAGTAVATPTTDSDGGVRLSFLRQQHVRPGEPCLCLSDFVAPRGHAASASPDVEHTIGVFAAAVDADMEKAAADDGYEHLLVQTLCDRLAEAAAERMHEEVRRTYWGYAPEERLTQAELFAEKYAGRRPAVGYPSLPDQSIIFELHRLLDFDRVGITLTESGMMQPHAAVAGLLFGHSAARHFAVGTIDKEQLADYARRRGMDIATAAKFLAGNLSDSPVPAS